MQLCVHTQSSYERKTRMICQRHRLRSDEMVGGATLERYDLVRGRQSLGMGTGTGISVTIPTRSKKYPKISTSTGKKRSAFIISPMIVLFFIMAVMQHVAAAGAMTTSPTAKPPATATDRESISRENNPLDDSSRGDRLTWYLHNVVDKDFNDVDVGGPGVTQTKEASNDLRETKGNIPFGDNDVLPSEQDNAGSLVKRGNTESLAPIGNIYRDGNNYKIDKIEIEGDKESGTVFGVNNMLKEGDKQLENGVKDSASEEQVSGNEGGKQKDNKVKNTKNKDVD